MKHRRLRFTRRAREDFLHLLDWIAERAGRAVAPEYAERVEAFCESLTYSAERGHRRDVTEDEVRILGLYSGGRNWTG